MQKKILITGGFGYIGGQIAYYLSQIGYKVILASRTKREVPKWLPNGDVALLDIQNTQSIKNALNGVFAVIHLAAMNEIECAENPELAIEINTTGSLRVLYEAINANVSKFIYFSTIHVYGSPLSGIIDENTITKPTHPYAITHKYAEDFLLAKSNDINVNVFRLSNSFGAPMHYNINRWTLLVNDICRQVVMTGKIILKSDGSQLRDFITLDDVARATLNLIRIKSTNEIYNLGGENTLSILEMAKLVASRSEDVLQYKPQIIKKSSKANTNCQKLKYKIDKLKKTGFTLNKNINTAIDETLKFVNTHMQRNVTSSY